MRQKGSDMFDSWSVRLIASLLILGSLVFWRNHRDDNYMKFQQTPQGHAQTMANVQLDLIEACRKAAKEGVLGPGCQAAPQSSREKVLVIPPTFSQASSQ